MRIILITILLFAATSLFAQKTRHISVEILGAQNTVGINYDSRFKGTYGLGYRVGIGYGYGRNSGWFDESIKGVGVPLELNYLLGKKNSKLELGFGASLGIYRVKGEVAYYNNLEWYSDRYNTYEKVSESYYYTSSGCQFGYFLFGDIGYRYERAGGFMFRIGVCPLILVTNMESQSLSSTRTSASDGRSRVLAGIDAPIVTVMATIFHL